MKTRYFSAVLLLALTTGTGCGSLRMTVGQRQSQEREKETIKLQAQKLIVEAQAIRIERKEHIRTKDIVTVQVWMRDRATQFRGFPFSIEVPGSGQVFIPDVGITMVVGKTDAELRNMLSEHFSRTLQDATVVVEHKEKLSVSRADEAIRSARHVTILGWIKRPGIYPTSPTLTVRDMIAHAGGPKDFAKLSKVYVVRGPIDNPDIITVNLRQIQKGRRLHQNVVLLPNDAIYVPPGNMWRAYNVIRTVLLPITGIRDAVWSTSGL